MEKSISLADLPAGFYLVRADQCAKNLFQSPRPFSLKTIGMVTKNIQILPFLSLKDNLLLGVKKHRQLEISTYLSLVELSPEILSQEELTPLEKVKLQLVRQLLQEKKILLLNRCYKELSVKDVQWLLPFCHQLAHDKQLKIILFSSDKQLCQTPYIDQIF
ncbi:hypothetical protein [Enterococcus olivae]